MSHRSVIISGTKDSVRPAAESPQPDTTALGEYSVGEVERVEEDQISPWLPSGFLARPPSARVACLVLGPAVSQRGNWLLGTYKKTADQVRRKDKPSTRRRTSLLDAVNFFPHKKTETSRINLLRGRSLEQRLQFYAARGCCYLMITFEIQGPGQFPSNKSWQPRSSAEPAQRRHGCTAGQLAAGQPDRWTGG